MCPAGHTGYQTKHSDPVLHAATMQSASCGNGVQAQMLVPGMQYCSFGMPTSTLPTQSSIQLVTNIVRTGVLPFKQDAGGSQQTDAPHS